MIKNEKLMIILNEILRVEKSIQVVRNLNTKFELPLVKRNNIVSKLESSSIKAPLNQFVTIQFQDLEPRYKHQYIFSNILQEIAQKKQFALPNQIVYNEYRTNLANKYRK
ncbi:hypothetical protein SS50377_27689 [Spironucleus salmonicida]|uniref:Uncharacterized protein n=1 Tax=Spironucleus salmonicida TaxID=348837 RepID=V6LPJ8_9EUKA|nr:hypothetical protein SS50377_27689 [Spironucleus salmonicida]|eukprot:EST46535.1 Hypothetical protein SS50377_13340 [Spironucleus salmonicida]